MKPDPRATAIRVLLRVLSETTHLGVVWDDLSAAPLTARDRRFVQRLVLGVLRRLSEIDYRVGRVSRKPLERLDPEILWILRAAVYELLDSDTPERAVLHEWVRLCRSFRKASATSFVNGILREYLRRPVVLPRDTDPPSLAIRYSHPEWLVRRYLSRHGVKAATQLMELNNTEPEHFLWVNPFRASSLDLCRRLSQDGFPCEPVDSLPNCLKTPAAVAGHALYERGAGVFMDVSSQWVANLPDLSECRQIADLFAAPGGKSFVLASRLPAGGRLTASDISQRRILSMRERALKLGIPAISLVVADLSQGCFREETFDFVLLDVPCSGLGTLASNPDIRWRFRPERLAALQEQQLRLLSSVFPLLRRGRELLYSTCSTEEEENEAVVAEFLRTQPAAKALGPFRRTSPLRHGGQAFFAARLGRE